MFTKEKKIIEIAYSVPITESGILDNDFLINGVAINATTTSNNHKFIAEELKESAQTLNGVPLLVDHDNRVESIKGRVINGEYDEANSRINFKAKVVNSDIKKMIKDGLINSVSVGATVKEIEEDGDILIPRGIVFKELSLVAVPADAGATFTTALHEAYKSNIQPEKEEIPSPVSEELKGGIKMSEEIKTEQPAEAPKEEVKAEEPKPEPAPEPEAPKAEENLKLKELTEALEAMKKKLSDIEAKEKTEALKSEVREEVEEKALYNIVQGLGSLRGYSFTLVR